MTIELRKIIVTGFLSLLFLFPAWAQSAEDLFDERIVHDIHLQMDPDDWQQLRTQFRESTEYSATFEWGKLAAVDVTVRARGNASRNPLKPALTIKFSERFLGLKSLVLRNLVADASMMKERLVMQVFRAAGVVAPRVVHARLLVNGEYSGLYNLVERIEDAAFLQDHFGETRGTLFSYKNPGLYRLEWRGRDPGRYIPDPFKPDSDRYLDPMGIVNLIDTINNAPDGQFTVPLSAHLDLNAFLKYIAIETLMDDWDGFLGEYGVNNFLLYQHEDSQRFTFIPWDTKYSFFDEEDSIYKNWELSPLTRRLLIRPELRAIYLSHLERGVLNWVNPEWLLPRTELLYAQIREAAYEDALRGPIPTNPVFFEQEIATMRRFALRRGWHVMQQVSAAAAVAVEGFKLYFPLFVFGNNDVFRTGYATGLAVVNRTPHVASVRYTAYDMEGRRIGGPVEKRLEPGEQKARFERELFEFDGSSAQIGWVEVSSDVDIKGFFLTADTRLADSINGSDVSAQVGRDLVFMQAEVDPVRGINTYYAICNPNQRATRVRAIFSGFSRPAQDFVIPAKGLQVIRLDGATTVNGGYLRLISEEPITGTQLIGNATRIAILKPMFLPSAANELIFPHFAVNGGFATDISIINTAPGNANLTITALDSNGREVGRQKEALAPGQLLRTSVGGMFSLAPSPWITVGYLHVKSDVPGLVGFTQFDYGQGRAVAAVPVATVPSRNLTFSHVAYRVASGSGALYNTGVALVNPNGFSANFVIRLYDWQGNVIAQNRHVLDPFGKKALLLDEFIEDRLPSLAGGYLVVRSEIPLYGFELFFTDRVDQLAAVPAQ